MARRPTRNYSQRDSDADFIVSDEEVEQDVVQGRRRTATQSQADGFSALSEQQQDELKLRFLRYMLCRNARKRPVRRAELTKHLFHDMTNVGSKQRVFPATYQRVQATLRSVYGMQIVELKRKARKNTSSMPPSQVGFGGSMGGGGGGSSTNQKAYILMSTLPMGARVEDPSRMAEIGLLMVIAGIILLTPGCRVTEEQLYKGLEKVGVYVKDHQQSMKQFNNGNVRELIEKEWPDQWYLDREKEENTHVFSIGPRFHKEIEDQHLIEFVDAVYSIPGDTTIRLDSTAKRELSQRLESARKAFEDDDDTGK